MKRRKRRREEKEKEEEKKGGEKRRREKKGRRKKGRGKKMLHQESNPCRIFCAVGNQISESFGIYFEWRDKSIIYTVVQIKNSH